LLKYVVFGQTGMYLVEISWFWTDWIAEAENSVTVRRRRRRRRRRFVVPRPDATLRPTHTQGNTRLWPQVEMTRLNMAKFLTLSNYLTSAQNHGEEQEEYLSAEKIDYIREANAPPFQFPMYLPEQEAIMGFSRPGC
jgi:hypothetical protein